MVVDIEAVYDEFSFGIRDADAIWAFLRHAYTEWETPPKYVLLAGDGSYDYKDYLGYGDATIPSILAPTPHGLFPSDNLLADVEGNDGVAEMAIGRIPAVDAAALEAVVDKLIDFETSRRNERKSVVLAADRSDGAGDFTNASAALADMIPGEYPVTEVYADVVSAGLARATLRDAIASGPK